MSLLAQTNARSPPVQTTHIQPGRPSPPTPKQLQLGHWGEGGGKHFSIQGTPTVYCPSPGVRENPGSAPLRGARDCWGKKGGGVGRDCNICPLPGPAQTWPRTAPTSAIPHRGAQIPESLLHRASSGVAVRLPRDLSCLLVASAQAQPPKILYNLLSSGGTTDMTHNPIDPPPHSSLNPRKTP